MTFYVSSAASSYSVDVYRMGWYEGKGGALMMRLPALNGQLQPAPASPDPATGLLRAEWRPSFSLSVPDNWPSGMYMVKLTDADLHDSYIPFVVRGIGEAPIAFIHSVATDEAYNTWGGESFYSGSTPALRLPRAVYISFDRPFNQDFGAGDFFYYEYQMVRFLERNGLRADYLTDVDVHEHPDWLLRYRAVLIVGHDEYWSWSMRSAYLKAVSAGVNLAVFGANTAYREIRFQSTPTGPDRVEICYKSAYLDPEPNPVLKTAPAWREAPTNWDESQLLGAEYVPTGNVTALPWVVQDASSWAFAGTGLRLGSSLRGLLGYEEDQLGAKHPVGVVVLASSPVATDAGTYVQSNATIYQASSGAWVFDAGSVQWSWGLDTFEAPIIQVGLRPAVVTDRRPDYSSLPAQIIALNLLRKMLGSEFPADVDPSHPASPAPFQSPATGLFPSPSLPPRPSE